MPRAELYTHTRLAPRLVIAALTDFSERRPDIWPNLNREMYEVYEVGDRWAEIREGDSRKVWARERYDWSTPGTVKWTVVESPYASTGGSVTAVVTPKGGGSDLHITWDRTGKTTGAKLMLGVISLVGGPMLKRYFRKTLDGLADRRGTEI